MLRQYRVITAAILVGVAVVAGACASESLTPTEIRINAARTAPSSDLLQCSPLPSTTLMQTVGPEGGTMRIGPHVFVIPPGALARRVKITAKIGKGSVNAVQFGPSGLSFATPAQLTLSYANCDTKGLTVPKRVAYTSDELVVLEYVESSDDLSTLLVTGRVDHFSNYAVAW